MNEKSDAVQSRYTRLSPLSFAEQKRLCLDLIKFFNPLNARKLQHDLGLPATSSITPFTLGQFYEWSKRTPGKKEYDRLRPHIKSLLGSMVQGGILSFEGRCGAGINGDGGGYFAIQEMSRIAAQGTLYLGAALGLGYLAHEFSSALVAITGKHKSGDLSTGSGLHVLPEYIITCDHVLRDMEVNRTVEVNGTTVSVEPIISKEIPSTDVGVLRIRPGVPVSLPDLAFREAMVLEKVLVAGFPHIPTSTDRIPFFQAGEISTECAINTYHRNKIELFSAIARPGNSGGPVISSTGNIVGLVTQSLEREKEDIDPMRPLPFFASVPAASIREAFRALTNQELPWESYQ